MDKKKGHYIGTEINEKWWSRYRGEGFFARGNGEYWFDEDFFYFRRYLTKEPIKIPFNRIQEIKTGNWHAGRWCAMLNYNSLIKRLAIISLWIWFVPSNICVIFASRIIFSTG